MSKFERCTRSIARGLARDGVRVVARAGAVRRPHLAQLRAALLDDVGNAERAADLDQLAARHDHFLPRRHRREERASSPAALLFVRMAASQPKSVRQMRGEVLVARAALALLEIELEVRVPAHDLLRLGPDRRIDRRAAEVRVDDDAAAVDDAAERRARGRGERSRADGGHRLGFVVGRARGAQRSSDARPPPPSPARGRTPGSAARRPPRRGCARPRGWPAARNWTTGAGALAISLS